VQICYKQITKNDVTTPFFFKFINDCKKGALAYKMKVGEYLILLGVFLLFGIACKDKKPLAIDQGKVVAVKDGDTIEILANGKTITIRFAHIDCPEKKQPFGTKAKSFTSEHCFGQTVKVIHKNEYDRYKRLIAEIINEKGENVNQELVKAGLAWHFKKYSADTLYENLEIQARLQKTGVWSEDKPIAPWDWRGGKKNETNSQ
jgi:endonuclease YncB( thermonuclease family)